jgi:hypothetical protein
MSLTSHLVSRQKSKGDKHHHITLIEEAHRLMSAKSAGGGEFIGNPRAQASEDFANILAEVRGFNESILIAEQIPTELVSGAIANTYVKIMHWLEEQSSFMLFSDVMNLNKQQREYARTLPTGQAIVRGFNGRPILVQVRNYLDQFQHADDTPIIDDSDLAISLFMKKQVEKFNFQIPEPVEYTPMRNVATDENKVPDQIQVQNQIETRIKDAPWLLSLPMQTCVYCDTMLCQNICLFGAEVRGKLMKGIDAFRESCEHLIDEFLVENNQENRYSIFDTLSTLLEKHYLEIGINKTPYQLNSILYCYLAHRSNEILFETLGDQSEGAKLQRQRARQLLTNARRKVLAIQVRDSK